VTICNQFDGHLKDNLSLRRDTLSLSLPLSSSLHPLSPSLPLSPSPLSLPPSLSPFFLPPSLSIPSLSPFPSLSLPLCPFLSLLTSLSLSLSLNLLFDCLFSTDYRQGQGAPLRAARTAPGTFYVFRPQETGIRGGIQVDRAVPRLDEKEEEKGAG
jgi:hypothetical protein